MSQLAQSFFRPLMARTALTVVPLLLAAACDSGTNNTGGSGGTGNNGGSGGNVGGGGSGNMGGTGGDVGGSGGANGGSGGIVLGGNGGTGGSGGCQGNAGCPDGEICDVATGACVTGCAVDKPCVDAALTCCDVDGNGAGDCVNTQDNNENCGACGTPCVDLPNSITACDMGLCQFFGCDAGFNDCDGDVATGCETSGQCACVPGEMQSCYSGPPGTEGVGACTAGVRTCNANGLSWGPCLGEVLPDNEICGNGIDEDCNNGVDDPPDADGDGWNYCQGDCCDSVSMGCSEPAKVNPGAFEALGNMVDDDCDPATSDAVPPAACSSQAVANNVTALQLAQAMDICQQTTANPPLPQKKWGLIGADLVGASGAAAAIKDVQKQVRTSFGAVVGPQLNGTMAAISSGSVDPMTSKQGGTNNAYSSPGPGVYLAAHGNKYVTPVGCPDPVDSTAYDPVNLRMAIRVPTNAQSFSYKFRFYSAEWPEYVCTQFNDFFLALLTTSNASFNQMYPDHNISFDANNNAVSVSNGFLEVCTGGNYTNVNGQPVSAPCPQGPAELAGTNYGTGNPPVGGGTKWLTTTAPAIPGETMTLELMVFDVGDGAWDTQMLLDAFQWSINPSGVSTGG